MNKVKAERGIKPEPGVQPAAKRQRTRRQLPPKVESAEKELESNEWDTAAWLVVLSDAQATPIDVSRETYERFLELFPTSARWWKQYIDQEMLGRNFSRVEALFPRCLFQCLDVDLWITYLTYIKMAKSGEKDEAEQLDKAYTFVLKHMGHDLNSCPVWSAYIVFLKHQQASNPVEAKEKTTRIRKAYQQVLLLPINGTDALWREYDAWEHSSDKELAKGLLSNIQEVYLQARLACRERTKHHRGLVAHHLARPPQSGVHNQEKDYQQVLLWKTLLEFEIGNQQKLSEPELEKRMVFTFTQALMCLRHYPEIWEAYAMFHDQRGHDTKAIAVFKTAIKAIPYSTLMHFVYAEYLESRNKLKEAKVVLEHLLQRHAKPIVYIHIMSFLRRCESAEAARKLFLQARKSSDCTFHVYVAAARMEYLQNQQPKLAAKIYHFGLTHFASEPAFVFEYLEFLKHQHDPNTQRVVFERALGAMEGDNDNSVKLWKAFVEFQKVNGSLKSIVETESRMNQVLREKTAGLSRQLNKIDRFSFLGLLPCDPIYRQTLSRSSESRISQVNQRKVVHKPNLASMVEYRPGTPFLPHSFRLPQGAALPAVHIVLRKLIDILPPPQLVQGVPLSVDRLMHVIVKNVIPPPAPEAGGRLVDLGETVRGTYDDTLVALAGPAQGKAPAAKGVYSAVSSQDPLQSGQGQPQVLLQRPHTQDLFETRMSAAAAAVK